jgi:hypothetical protein
VVIGVSRDRAGRQFFFVDTFLLLGVKRVDRAAAIRIADDLTRLDPAAYTLAFKRDPLLVADPFGTEACGASYVVFSNAIDARTPA